MVEYSIGIHLPRSKYLLWAQEINIVHQSKTSVYPTRFENWVNVFSLHEYEK